MSNGKYFSFPRSVAARHIHLLHTHQGSSAQLVVSARIGTPTSRCYDAARRACCDAATRLNDPKASHSQALSRTTKHPTPLIFETSPLEPPPPSRDLPPLPETLPEQRPLPRTPRGPPERERRGRSRKSKAGFAFCFSKRTTAKQSVERITQKR